MFKRKAITFLGILIIVGGGTLPNVIEFSNYI